MVSILNNVRYHPEELIEAVKSRPCIWLSSYPGYNDKDVKRVAWQAILRELIPDFDSYSPEDMLQLIAESQKKWRNMKDCFTKELRRRQNSKLGFPTKRPYRYYREMKFLFETEPYKNDDQLKNESSDSSVSQDVPEKMPRSYRLARKRKLGGQARQNRAVDVSQHSVSLQSLPVPSSTSSDPLGIPLIENTNNYEIPKIHPDMAFFMALVPAIQTLDVDQKLYFQMKVLQTLRSIKRESSRKLTESPAVKADRVYDISELKGESLSDSEMSFDEKCDDDLSNVSTM